MSGTICLQVTFVFTHFMIQPEQTQFCVSLFSLVSVTVVACSHPGDYGEEGEGDCSPSCISPLVEWQLISRGPRPLIGQEAETYEVQKGPETCQKSVEG